MEMYVARLVVRMIFFIGDNIHEYNICLSVKNATTA